MIKFIGFNHEPYAVIFWYKGNEVYSKTMCDNETDIAKCLDDFVNHKLYKKFDYCQLFKNGILHQSMHREVSA